MWKKLRATLGNAVTWAATWGIWGSLIAPVIGGMSPRAFLFVSGYLALFGFLGGATFSAMLGLIYRKSTLPELRPLRMGVLGVL